MASDFQSSKKIEMSIVTATDWKRWYLTAMQIGFVLWTAFLYATAIETAFEYHFENVSASERPWNLSI